MQYRNMISKFKILFLLAAAVITSNHCHGQYLGGTSSWRTQNHSNDSQIMVKATFSRVNSGSCVNPGSWSCYATHSNGSACVNLYNSSSACTSVYSNHYASMSTVQFTQSIDDSTTYRQSGGSWWDHSNLYGRPSDYSVPFHMNLAKRTDTGKPNSSPVAYVPTYIRFYEGCSATKLRIATFDEDGDSVTCRFGENTLENGDVTNSYSHISLDERNCTLSYDGGRIDHDVPITMIVEDHSTRDPTTNHSYVPLQFLVQGTAYEAVGRVLRALDRIAPTIRSNIPQFYSYNYDASGIQNHISDGGGDMFDVGNQVYYRVGTASYQQIVYRETYRDLNVGLEVSSSTEHPFMMLMFVGNRDGIAPSFDIKVQANVGADGSGSYTTYSGSISRSGMNLQYRAYNIWGADDPSICEVFFFMANPSRWGSTPPTSFRAIEWSSGTHTTLNTMRAEGSPRSIVMGYTLLSRVSDFQVTETQVRTILTLMMTTVNYFPAIEVGTSSSYCNVENVIERPRENQKFSINSNEEFQLIVQARKYSRSSSINYIEMNGAAYMTADHSSPLHLGDGLYQTSFTWTPRDDDQGQNFVCFTAYDDTYSYPSDQRCVIINVDVVTCDHHTDPFDGEVDCTNLNIMDSTCTFTCNYGYELIGEPVSECGFRGWSTPAPTCRVLTCDSQSYPSNGGVNCTNSNIFGSQCTFVCNHGYKLVGEAVSQCGFDGWNTPAPSCPRSCDPEYSDPSNGAVNCTNSNIWNSTCEFTCNYAYELIGEQVSQCEFDGWSTNASRCEIITCEHHTDPSDGEVSCTNINILDSTCTFACDYGYELIGEPASECGLRGWSTPAPSCQIITCDQHTDPTDGRVNCSNSNIFNSTCAFTCNYAYELIGDPASQCGVTGWNATAPNCQNGCELQGTSCSDACDELLDSEYTCSCHRSCWELASDRATCIPKIETTCTRNRIQVTVAKCAVDGDVMIGDYDPDRNLPTQCLPTESADYYHFDIPLGQCQSAVIDTAGGKRQSVLVKGWVEDPQQDLTNDSSPLARGSWYRVQVNCETETAFDVSTSFDPDDSVTSVVTEIGFGPIQLNFDFYRNLTFEAIYENEEYPIGFRLEDRIFFGILAQTNDSDVELFTKSCQAVADPNPSSISQVQLINNGCFLDESMRIYPASDPLRNHFSIEAFRFKTSLPGITEATDVRIECRVVLCIQLENVTTSCHERCVNSSSRSNSADSRMLVVDRDQLASERSAIIKSKVARTTSDHQGVVETGSIQLKKSGPIHLIDDSQGGGTSVHLYTIATACMTLVATFLILP